MRHGIVEGEPGIFPDPISRLMRKISGLFDRKRDRPAEPEASTDDAPEPDAERPSDDRPGSPPEDEDQRPPKPAEG